MIELSVTIVVLLSLIVVFFYSIRVYVDESNRIGCLTAQEKLQKVLRSYSMLNRRPFREGVDYYGDPNVESSFGKSPTCPVDGGDYTAFLDSGGQDLVITCLDHGHSHN